MLAQEGGLFYSYRVKDKKEKITRVLKLLSNTFIEKNIISKFHVTLNEIKSIRHKCLPEIFDVSDIDGHPYFTMEYLEGLSLKKLLSIRAEGKQFFTLSESESIITPVIELFEFIHSKNIIHGDLKPENILILPDAIKVTDLGIYKLLEPQEFISLQLAMGEAYYYFAPEFISRKGHLSFASDIYSIGAIIYEMFANIIPKGKHNAVNSYNHEVSAELNGLIMKCIEDDPSNRTKTVRELKKQWFNVLGKHEPETIEVVPVKEKSPDSAVKEKIAESPLVEEDIRTEKTSPVEKTPKINRKLKEEELIAEESASITERPTGPSGEKVAKFREVEIVEPSGQETVDIDFSAVRKLHPKTEDQTKVISFPVKLKEDHVKKHKNFPFVIILILLGIAGTSAFIFMKFNQKEEPSVPVVESRKDVQVVLPAGKREVPTVDENVPVVLPKEKARKEEALPTKISEPEKKKIEVRRKTEEKVAAAKQPPVEPPNCPENMVYIRAGNFIMGSSIDDPMKDTFDNSFHDVYVGEFCIDKYEYPGTYGVIPTSRISWYDAKKICEAAGKRLCSEEEWERACKSARELKFPYGNKWDGNACNTEDGNGNDRSVSSSGVWHRCKSEEGVFDMSGNLREWTNAKFSATVGDMVVKGGSYTKPDWAARCAVRYNMGKDAYDSETGVRCCRGVLK